MGAKWWMLGISGALLAVAILSLAVNGLVFGIEFQGGTLMTFTGKDGLTVEQMRSALGEVGVPEPGNAPIQKAEDGSFIVRTSEPDPEAAAEEFAAIIDVLGLPAQDTNVTTIGPGWGENVTNAALLALAISLVAILGYVSLRFDYKMSLTAVAALVHDVAIVFGIFSIFGREVTPNTMAALLTILGYSLYDTIVVFHRIRENSQGLMRQTFQSMANDSINQVFARSINTSLTSVIPVACLLAFGGSTLKDFAFALLIGLISSTYSSFGVASPLYVLWKEREPKFAALKKKFDSAASS
jgi:SecD/SecF fusion protein